MKRILVAEDDTTTQTLIRTALQATYLIVTASDGDEALEIARRDGDIQLIICDIMMPKKTGIEMVELLRKTPGRERIPVIFLTTRGTPDDVKAAIALKAVNYLKKPIRIAMLRDSVRKALYPPPT
ncbi:MAG: response regulator [Polyangiaceae bacterium]|nr:response regulator [Polyangiaceae bacterium]